MNVPVSSADKQRMKREIGEVIYNFEKATVPIKPDTSNNKNNEQEEKEKQQSKSSILPSIGLLLLIGTGLWWKREHIGEIAHSDHSDGDAKLSSTMSTMNTTMSNITKLPDILYNICMDIYNGETTNNNTTVCVLRQWVRWIDVQLISYEAVDVSIDGNNNDTDGNSNGNSAVLSSASASSINSNDNDKNTNTTVVSQSQSLPIVSKEKSRKTLKTLKKRINDTTSNSDQSDINTVPTHQHHDSPIWLQRPRSGSKSFTNTDN